MYVKIDGLENIYNFTLKFLFILTCVYKGLNKECLKVNYPVSS